VSTNEKNILKKFGLQPRKSAPEGSNPKETAVVNTMTNPLYLRQSSSLIQDALKNGLDVLQLANGDIVTTGTKTIVTKYSWDTARNKLVKLKAAKPAAALKKTAEPKKEEKVLEETEDA
jgi:hypothetical protein